MEWWNGDSSILNNKLYFLVEVYIKYYYVYA